MLPVLSKDYPQAAQRPAYSVMDKSKIKENYGLINPSLEDQSDKMYETVKIIL